MYEKKKKATVGTAVNVFVVGIKKTKWECLNPTRVRETAAVSSCGVAVEQTVTLHTHKRARGHTHTRALTHKHTYTYTYTHARTHTRKHSWWYTDRLRKDEVRCPLKGRLPALMPEQVHRVVRA